MSARHGRAAGIAFILCLVGATGIGLALLLVPPATLALTLLGEVSQLALCAAAAAILCVRGRMPLFCRPQMSPFGWVCALLCFLVALNNLPWLALLSGAACVSAGAGEVALFALFCLLTAVFEELLFRGFLFPLCLGRLPSGKWGRLTAILLSSAIFALSHLLNLAAGATLIGTLLQVGYSFLVGAAAAVLLLHSRNLTLPIAFHALYNFGGLLIPRLGEGRLFDRPTVIITAIIATVTAVCLTVSLFCGKKEDFFCPQDRKR